MQTYAIFGNGRVGASLSVFLRSLGHEVCVVTRASSPEQARAAVARCDVAAAAIPDDALEVWGAAWRGVLDGKLAIHFSGARRIDAVWGYHPLYSFPSAALPPETMSRIAFACQPGAPALPTVFPGAPNPSFAIADADRALYHALAVVTGNLAAFAFNAGARAFRERFGADAGPLYGPYFESVVARFVENPEASLTGPLARRDAGTVVDNLAALAGEPTLRRLYEALAAEAWPDRPRVSDGSAGTDRPLPPES